MKNFSQFLNETAATKRQGIVHLQKMKDLDFIDFVKKIKPQLKDNFLNVHVSLKVDGLGARFGKNINGRFFFEGSRTGPIFTPKSFSSFHKQKGTTDEILLQRADHYDNMFDLLRTQNFVKNLPNNVKVVCEIFYNPMAEKTKAGFKFVNVVYDRSRLGETMTIVLLDVLNSDTGEQLKNKNEIISQLKKSSNKEIQIQTVELRINKSIDISGVVDPVLSLNQDLIFALSSRKKADKAHKENAKAIVQNVKDQLADYLLKSEHIDGKFLLGPEFEGLILKFDDNLVKITTPEFKKAFAAKRG